VWAIDFSEAPRDIEGEYPYLLAVRDLASKYTLLWQPVVEMTAEVTVAALSELFAAWGAPLLLKADNGAPFHAEATTSFLAAMQVQVLYSPAYTPRYNGAIEAGIGSLKTRTRRLAAGHGHAVEWTCDDVEAAWMEANTLSFPFGENGPTPDARRGVATTASGNRRGKEAIRRDVESKGGGDGTRAVRRDGRREQQHAEGEEAA
jgi:hypothetical protein